MSNKALTKVKRVNSGKKKAETPEGSMQATPTASAESINQEPISTIDLPLDSKEIAALAVATEDLIKLHPPRPPCSKFNLQTSKKKILVKETVSSDPERYKSKRVKVLHPLPPGTVIPISKQLALTPPGPRFDNEGTFMPHSILGDVNDFASELKQRKLISSTDEFTHPPPIVESKVPNSTALLDSSGTDIVLPREENALEYWNQSMAERRAHQNYLAEKMESFPENLVMNRGEAYRALQEERLFIDRAIPNMDEGKGYRVGSEFWKQMERLGDEKTGINISLTKTEQGFPPEVEYIGVPNAVKEELGVDMTSDRNTSVPYVKLKDTYLSTRRKQLEDTLKEIEHFRPSVSELQVIGHATGTDIKGSKSSPSVVPSSRCRIRTDSLDSLGDDKYDSVEVNDSTMETEGETSKGPLLRVDGTMLQWMGPPLQPPPAKPSPPVLPQETRNGSSPRTSSPKAWLPSEKSTESMRDFPWPKEHELVDPIKCRVLLECSSGEITTSCLEMENCGTTAIYYMWEPIAKPNPLGTVHANNRQRFYFDTRGGVLLPAERLDFPFHFKSPNPGIFSEMWLLTTAPVLNKGRPLVVTLKGVASQEDLFKDRREEMERIMVHREAVAAVQRIVNGLVDSIKTPPRTPVRRNTVKMEEDIFLEKNPEMYYHYNTVQQLKSLHDVTLYPDYFQEPTYGSLTPTGFPSKGEKEKGGGGKKEDKSGGTSKRAGGGGGGGSSKDKKAPKTPAKEDQDPQPGTQEPPPDFIKWDLSIAGLLKDIMNIEDETMREDKLKQLNYLVGELSFPPLPATKKSIHHLCYMCLCDAVDQLVGMSAHLSQVMGIPYKEWCDRGDKRGVSGEDTNVLIVPGSPGGHKSKGEKRGSVGKEKKEGKRGAREKTQTPTHKPKKHGKASTSPRAEPIPNEANETTSAVEVDPVLEHKYKENLYTSVYRILEQAVDKMVALIESEKTVDSENPV